MAFTFIVRQGLFEARYQRLRFAEVLYIRKRQSRFQFGPACCLVVTTKNNLSPFQTKADPEPLEKNRTSSVSTKYQALPILIQIKIYIVIPLLMGIRLMP